MFQPKSTPTARCWCNNAVWLSSQWKVGRISERSKPILALSIIIYEVNSNPSRQFFIHKNKNHERRKFILIFSLLELRKCGSTFCCALCVTRRHSQINPWSYNTMGHPHSFLKSSGVGFELANSFILLGPSYSVLSGLARFVG